MPIFFLTYFNYAEEDFRPSDAKWDEGLKRQSMDNQESERHTMHFWGGIENAARKDWRNREVLINIGVIGDSS